ncbi:MAG: aldose 1-epimerase [Candidatus Omnitrophota bacterium]|jgi:aldose 1-epimerase
MSGNLNSTWSMMMKAMLRITGIVMTAMMMGACGSAEKPSPTVAPASTPAVDEPETISEPDENAPEKESEASVSKEAWGDVDGKAVYLYTLTNTKGLVARITNYGAILTQMHVPDRDGKLADIVHGFDNLQQYVDGHPYFGAMVGRVANRIGKGTFTIDGTTYTLAKNNGENHLHGGVKGFDKVIWDVVEENGADGPSLTLTYTSPDGEEGYPGTAQIKVIYTLTNDNELKIDMHATSDKKTPINLAHHTYWNLQGPDGGSILDHELQISSERYTVFDEEGIPTGEIAGVDGTGLDFTYAHKIGKEIAKFPASEDGSNPGGYDHNWVVHGTPGELRWAATLHEPDSGRTMRIESTQPGIQFYTGNYMDGSTEGKGTKHVKQSALCLETQHFPDSVNQPKFPSSVIGPGEEYREVMIHKFTTR